MNVVDPLELELEVELVAVDELAAEELAVVRSLVSATFSMFCQNV